LGVRGIVEGNVWTFRHDGGVQFVNVDGFARGDGVGTEPQLRGSQAEPPRDLGAREALDQERVHLFARRFRADETAERLQAAPVRRPEP